ncbi:hypothetical protein AGOR_G00120690 [Albula goreensis]|uniref:Transmembrane protein n=1 Tax=Albula goreensis TaxID=1534307 RepID=A0A8T3DFE0_9TELE|nr:hypothetical protein AGOR_G00120690 [Albula goreensis]
MGRIVGSSVFFWGGGGGRQPNLNHHGESPRDRCPGGGGCRTDLQKSLSPDETYCGFGDNSTDRNIFHENKKNVKKKPRRFGGRIKGLRKPENFLGAFVECPPPIAEHAVFSIIFFYSVSVVDFTWRALFRRGIYVCLLFPCFFCFVFDAIASVF